MGRPTLTEKNTTWPDTDQVDEAHRGKSLNDRLWEQVEFYADAHGIDVSAEPEPVETDEATVGYLFGDDPCVFVKGHEVGAMSRADAERWLVDGLKPGEPDREVR